MPSDPWLICNFILICSFNLLVLHEILLVPVLMYGSETMLWTEKERSRVRVEQMGNLRGLMGIRRMDSLECMDKRVMQSEERSR